MAGFTLIELLIIVAVLGVIAGMAIPGLLKARISADEAAAVASLRAINSAQAAYAASAGGGGYAATLAALAASCPAGSQPFISVDLGTDPSLKSGYRMTLQAAAGLPPGQPDCNGTATYVGYYSTAAPIAHGVTGRTAFASNSSGTIFFDGSGATPTEAQMAPGGGGQALR